jgi:hypothetical protein
MPDVNLCTMTLSALATLLAAYSNEPPPPPPADLSLLSPKEWVLQNFSGERVYTNSNNPGTYMGYYNSNLVWPAVVRDATVEGNYYGIRMFACDPYGEPSTCVPGELRVAFVDVVVRNQQPSRDGSYYGASIITDGGPTWNQTLATYMVNVTMEPNWPAWAGYDHTNMDGFTGDGGYPDGILIGYQVTVRNWAEAALDVKQKSSQFVGLHTESTPERGFNTLKLWHGGPHYLVDSTINNERYLNNPAIPPWSDSDDGGLVWTWDCANLELRIWNSTFNGSPTLPRDRITCTVGDRSQVKITYLTQDPRKTGEMHPMLHQATMPRGQPR